MSDSRHERFGPAVAMRRRIARGTVVNATFLTAINVLAMSRGVLMAGFLAPEEYAIWAVLVAIMATLIALRQIGISDQFVRQDEADQELEFQRAFSLEMAVAVALTLAGAAVVLVAAAAYGLPEVVAPGLLMLATHPAGALQIALGVFYRRMQFGRQRLLQSVDPVVAFVVTIGLAIAGAGYWSLVIGTVAGALAAAVVAAVASPYRFALRYDRVTLRRYTSFSWPLLASAVTMIVTAHGLIAAGRVAVGLVGVGVIALVAQISQYGDRAGRAVTDTLYPAICAVRDRRDLLYESFVKSNRFALMWSIPFGAGMALFADDLLTRVLDPRWGAGVELLQLTAIALALHQIGFSWTAFYRALGNTRPIALYGVVGLVCFGGLAVPALLVWELAGLGVAVLVSEVVFLGFRALFLRRIFAGFSFGRHVLRAVWPTIPAVAAVLVARLLADGERTLAVAGGEAALFLAVAISLTWRYEAPLMREVIGYLRRGAGPAAPA